MSDPEEKEKKRLRMKKRERNERRVKVFLFLLLLITKYYFMLCLSGSCVAQLSVNHRRGAGVLDLRFESPNELLTCGYDTFIRLWDLRTHSW